jgi:hypothetical protein
MASLKVPVEEELGLGWSLVYIPLDRDNLPTGVICSQWLGSDWSGVRTLTVAEQAWTGSNGRTYSEPG